MLTQPVTPQGHLLGGDGVTSNRGRRPLSHDKRSPPGRPLAIPPGPASAPPPGPRPPTGPLQAPIGPCQGPPTGPPRPPTGPPQAPQPALPAQSWEVLGGLRPLPRPYCAISDALRSSAARPVPPGPPPRPSPSPPANAPAAALASASTPGRLARPNGATPGPHVPVQRPSKVA